MRSDSRFYQVRIEAGNSGSWGILTLEFPTFGFPVDSFCHFQIKVFFWNGFVYHRALHQILDTASWLIGVAKDLSPNLVADAKSSMSEITEVTGLVVVAVADIPETLVVEISAMLNRRFNMIDILRYDIYFTSILGNCAVIVV